MGVNSNASSGGRRSPSWWSGLLSACLAGLASVTSVAAHELWIAPSSLTPQVGDRVALELILGHVADTEKIPRNPHQILRFDGRVEDGVVDVVGFAGRTPAGLLRMPGATTVGVAYESHELSHRLGGAKFQAYLVEKGWSDLADLREHRGTEGSVGRELYSRSLKALLAPAGSMPIDRDLGLPLEIHLEESSPDAGTTVRVELHDRPATGLLLRVLPLRGAGEAFERRTDGEGRLQLPLRPGAWRISGTWIEPLEHEQAEWRSWWASLTFALPETGDLASRGESESP